ncbi:MAG: DUF998 domain-containing protein [Methanomassiliicoccales archaeon]
MNLTRNPGFYLLIGSLQFFLLLLTAECLRPSYSVSLDYLSDLGVGSEPSRTLFNATLIIFGLSGFAASYLFWKADVRNMMVVTLMMSSVGVIGVGLFPEDTGAPHALFALIGFFFGALTAVISFKIVKPPYAWFGVILGLISIASLFMFLIGAYLGLGAGGMERMVLYPSLLWYVGLGGYLLRPDERPG